MTKKPAGDTVAARFWAKVQKSDGCWEWQGTKSARGYGGFYVGRPKMGKAHRVSWEMHNGPIPPGMYICHHCDNPPCVRPDHLFLGTALDNNVDCMRKGRTRGTKTHCKRGHEQTLENTRQLTVGSRLRRCFLCSRERSYRYYRRNGKGQTS